ncbi:MAG TPA: phenylalanine--tRNA ligase subunit beta [Candidatus Binataceae bacterium]|nr:phenylalanine--tRNA ligase subunit beta [Candidatus Binataceae bacterium]
MKLPLSWLGEFVSLPFEVEEIGRRLTAAGVEVENLERLRPAFSDVVVARVLKAERHPNADRLSLCEVDAGPVGRFSVVCGAPNVRAGMTAAYARVGARLRAGVHGAGGAASVEQAPPLQAAVIRGVKSDGMLCSERELGLSDEHEGILELSSGDPGADLAATLQLDDVVLDIAITPNRGDCLSVIGLAREIAALFGVKMKPPRIAPLAHADHAAAPIAVEIQAPDLCPRYAALAMSGVKVGPSPAWLKRRLELSGMRAVSNVVDATNYVMLELGQPLHAFDYARLAGGKIIVRRAGTDREMTTLDGLRRELLPDDLVIADAEKPVALAGVMGGGNSEVSAATETILLESAYFEALTVARTGRRLGLRSEASYRFERGIDRAGQVRALHRIAAIIRQIASGRPAGALVDVEARPSSAREITLEAGAIAKLLGVEIPSAEVSRRLKALGATVRPGGRGRLIVTAPSFRPDLNESADLAEEVARLRGLDEIPAIAPARTSAGPAVEDASRIFARASREVMLGCGLTEIKSIAFVAPADNQAYPGIGAGETVRVTNPLSAELGEMRRSLIPGLRAALQFNLNREAGAFHAFEIGRAFVLKDRESAPEAERLAGISYGEYALSAIGRPGVAADFLTTKGIVERYLQALPGAPRASFEPPGDGELRFLHPGKSAHIRVGGALAGYVGELHPGEAMRLELGGACGIFELDLTLLAAWGAPEQRPIELPPRFPAVRRDLALLVDRAMAAATVLQALAEMELNLLESVRLFDVYEGGSLPPGKKSVGIACLYRARDRTLTDGEVNRAHAQLVEQARTRLGAELRQ